VRLTALTYERFVTTKRETRMRTFRLDVLHKTAASEYAGSVFVDEDNLKLVLGALIQLDYCVQVVDGPDREPQQ
jgi:hypothetical protein